MDSLDTESQGGVEDMRNLTRSALGPLVGESSSDQDDRDIVPRNLSRSSYVIDDNVDDIDDEITAVFNDDNEDCMSKSWHGSRSSSQRSLAFFVDLNSSEAGGPPPLHRSNSNSQSGRKVCSARARTRAGSCSTSFFVELKEEGCQVRSTSRLESSGQLSQISDEISNKSKLLLETNLQQSQLFFTKLKAFIDFLNLPNYSKAEVRHKKVLADKITRVMFEEEQRLRRGMNLSELKNLDSILNVRNSRPNSAYAAMQNSQNTGKISSKSQENSQCSKSTATANSNSGEKPILRREKTFDLEHSSILSQDLKLMKKQNRKSMPVNMTVPIIDSEENEEKIRNGWMIEDSKKSHEDEKIEQWSRSDSGEMNLLKYFQQQRLEHTRLLRKEISRLENLEKVYLSAIKKTTGIPSEKKIKSIEMDKQKKVLLKIDETNNFNRKETFTKSDRKRVTEKLSRTKERNDPPGKTNFRELADRKKRNDGCGSVLPSSDPNSPLSWYIPSEPSSRSGSKNSEVMEDVPHQAKPSQGSQANIRTRTSSVSNQQSFGWSHQSHQSKYKNKHFAQMFPSRQASQDSDIPPSQCRGSQTGRSLLRMYLRKADKGQQVCERPQAFFLPLDQTSPDQTDLIDLETNAEKDKTDLQEALRKNRPDYIAAAEERAGRLSRGDREDNKSKDSAMTRSTETKTQKQITSSLIKRSQSSPRVSSILKPNNQHSSIPSGISTIKNGIQKKPERKAEKKSVTIMQNSEPRKSRNNVAVIKSRNSMANQQHYNIKNIYAPDPVNNMKNKVY